MKQTKLREPILYTALWVVSVVIACLIWMINDTGILWLDFIIAFVLFLFLTYAFLWWLLFCSKWSDRCETRDMEKYILWKIKDIDDEIEELENEIEELLLSIKD